MTRTRPCGNGFGDSGTADFGFDSTQADYAITVAKVAVGRAVGPISTIAHQLHGAIGVTMEHRLWLATMRARSWGDEFGTTGYHARRLGRMALAADDPWTVVVGPSVRRVRSDSHVRSAAPFGRMGPWSNRRLRKL